jgi:hypothetical protein
MNITKTHILYLIITTLIVILLNVYIASNDMYQLRIKKIDTNYANLNEAIANPSDKLLLVIGNSYVNASFNDSFRNESTVKFAVNGMFLSEIVNVVENIPEKTPIKAILVGIGYNDATPSNSDSSSYEKHFSQNLISEMWYSLPMVRGRSRASLMLREDFYCLISDLLKTRCKREAFEEARGKEADLFANPKYREMDIAKRFNEYIPFTSSVHQNFTSLLERLIAACKLRGIELYAYTAPIYKNLLDKLDNNVITKFHTTISETGINYVDMNLLLPDWDYSMFSDATHVNFDKASIPLTNILLDRIFPVKTDSQ